MLSSIPLWLHILAAAIWIGSQVMLFAVVMPALRGVDDTTARQQMLRDITRRFGMLGAGALAVLIISGIENVSRYSPQDMLDFRYGTIFGVKMTLLTLVLVLTAAHAFIGAAQMRAQEAMVSNPSPALAARLQTLRSRSVMAASLTLLLSLAILFCAVLLRSGYAATPA